MIALRTGMNSTGNDIFTGYGRKDSAIKIQTQHMDSLHNVSPENCRDEKHLKLYSALCEASTFLRDLSLEMVTSQTSVQNMSNKTRRTMAFS